MNQYSKKVGHKQRLALQGLIDLGQWPASMSEPQWLVMDSKKDMKNVLDALYSRGLVDCSFGTFKINDAGRQEIATHV